MTGVIMATTIGVTITGDLETGFGVQTHTGIHIIIIFMLGVVFTIHILETEISGETATIIAITETIITVEEQQIIEHIEEIIALLADDLLQYLEEEPTLHLDQEEVQHLEEILLQL